MINIGIIGCGGIARYKHIPELLKLPDVHISALCDMDTDKARDCVVDFKLNDTKIFNDYEKFFCYENLDVVHICTPNSEHEKLALMALEAKKHVMIEKPLCTAAEGICKIKNMAKKSEKLVTIGYQRRFRRESLILKRICEQNVLGKVYFARGYAVRRRGVPNWGTFLNRERQGGGCLIDISCHTLDLILWLLDNYSPEYVVCNTYDVIGKKGSNANFWGIWEPDRFEVEDSAFAFIRMKDGTTISIDSSFALNVPYSLENALTLCGSKAGAVLDKDLAINGEMVGSLYNQSMDVSCKTGIYDTAECIDNSNYNQMKNWIDSIKNNEKPLVTLEQAAVVQYLISAMYISAEQKSAVYYDDFLEHCGS